MAFLLNRRTLWFKVVVFNLERGVSRVLAVIDVDFNGDGDD
jgi:hypothetical protein